MDCYVINLDRSTDRWERLVQSFSELELNLIRVSAVDGKTIEYPHPDYSEKYYRLYHGKKTNLCEVGCFFSHLKVLRTFLASSREHVLICEDDVSAKPELVDVLYEALRYRRSWDILWLNGLHVPFQVPVVSLIQGYHLTIPLTWFGGAGSYMVNRKAAERLLKHIVPMRIPYDHALDQNWLMGLTAAMIKPYPVILNETAWDSCIGAGQKYKLPFFRRYFTVLPYRGIMTLGRWGKQLSTMAKYLTKKPKPM
jgi:glycosyl transferase family 25